MEYLTVIASHKDVLGQRALNNDHDCLLHNFLIENYLILIHAEKDSPVAAWVEHKFSLHPQVQVEATIVP